MTSPLRISLLYFAYGSNLDPSWMTSRVPSAKAGGRAKLMNKRMVCNKRSQDGSGKGNIINSPGDAVWGALYEIEAINLAILDKVERGYRRTTLHVLTDDGQSIVAEVYESDDLTVEPVPYDWYKELIVGGARYHRLPQEHLEYLERLPSKEDPRSEGMSRD